MIRANPMDRFMAVGFNTDLMPRITEGTVSAIQVPADNVPLNGKMNLLSVDTREPVNVVPIRKEDSSNFFEAPVDKITNAEEMLKNAMKPVGPGATIFNPFNLLYRTNKSMEFMSRTY